MRYIFIDANNLAARCHYAISDMYTSEGQRTGGVYGFIKSCLWLKYTLVVPLSHVVIVWDGGRAKKRLELYPEYKAGRKLHNPKDKEASEDAEQYHNQLDIIRKIFNHTDVRQLWVKDTEADDLIGVYSNFVASFGHAAYIYSGDRDMHQLATPRVNIVDPKKGALTIDIIKNLWGVEIWEIPLFKALVGDTSDNIAGLPGVGEKRALKIVKEKRNPNETVSKWTQLYLDNMDIVERNIKLMQLPNAWTQSFYTVEQAQEANRQFLTAQKMHTGRLQQELNKWEMNPILDEMYRW